MSNRALKIKILLGIDTAFFFLELIVGTAVGSLALVADSFHMLNDVCSLVVALQALKLAESTATSSRYSYGWQRAEVLGALVNGVFLLALCFSIGLEAITRFFNSVEVKNPQLIVIVGSLGLASNIIGLFLFHDHGHSHGGHSHGGHSHGHSHSHGEEEATKPKIKHVHSHAHSSPPTDRTPLLAASTSSQSTIVPVQSRDTPKETIIPVASSSSSMTADEEEAERNDLLEEELFVHPEEFRGNIVKAAHDAGYGSTGKGHAHGRTKSVSSMGGKRNSLSLSGPSGHAGHNHDHAEGEHHSHEGHDHGVEEAEGASHGHDGEMNMRGVFLHVLGDALGNVGVIGAGLFIWLTDYSWRMYSDPFISLIITCIIFSSALPLVKSASFILLQGVPSSVPLDQVRSAIAAVPGVLNVHELHIWSLSESKTVASVHIMTNGEDIVQVSKTIRKVMHRFGIHSSTIQPEIVESKSSASPVSRVGVDPAAITPEDGCLIQCVDDSCAPNSCCPPTNGDNK